MIIVKCSKCGQKIFKYSKVGKGKLWNCWKNKIIKDYSIHDEDKIKCRCGNLIGIDKGKKIKMKQNSFTTSGTVKKQ